MSDSFTHSSPAVHDTMMEKQLADARTLLQEGRVPDAVRAYQEILLNADLPPFDWGLLGIAFRKLRCFHAALGCYKKSLEKGHPENAQYLTRMANVLVDLNQYQDALKYAEKALGQSDDKVVWFNYCFVLRECKQYRKALAILEGLGKRFPDDTSISWEKAFVGLHLQQGIEQWRAFGSRVDTFKVAVHPASEHIPRWNGECLQGKRILLVREQGFGDCILMFRYVPLLNKVGAMVELECKPDLWRLAESLPVNQLVEEKQGEYKQYDYFCYLMDLPVHLGIDSEVPPPCALTIPHEARQFNIPQDGCLNVGVLWSGSITFENNHKRASEIEPFLQLASDIHQARFVSLQKGAPLKSLYKNGGQFLIRDFGENLSDFAATAALIEKLDIVVMTDSAVAHLAATLGKPVLNLLNYNAYWLYGDGPTTPWYSSMRFIRQGAPGDWSTVFEQASKILKQLEQRKRAKRHFTSHEILTEIDKLLL